MAITDWDDAYANGAHIPGSDGFPAQWAAAAHAFRDACPAETISYGAHERQSLDLFRPGADPRGLCVYVHGGYWKQSERRSWSHMATGMIARGIAVALVGYRLTPEVRISDITKDVAAAINTAAGFVSGPISLVGHSAGGHLVCRMVSGAPLDRDVANRISTVCSIAGVHDLRPLLKTEMNGILHLDATEAAAESPVLLVPRPGTRLLALVGAAERPEFRRQTDLIANIWTGLGADTLAHHEVGTHHFDVVEALLDPNSLVCRFLDPGQP